MFGFLRPGRTADTPATDAPLPKTGLAGFPKWDADAPKRQARPPIPFKKPPPPERADAAAARPKAHARPEPAAPDEKRRKISPEAEALLASVVANVIQASTPAPSTELSGVSDSGVGDTAQETTADGAKEHASALKTAAEEEEKDEADEEIEKETQQEKEAQKEAQEEAQEEVEKKAVEEAEKETEKEAEKETEKEAEKEKEAEEEEKEIEEEKEAEEEAAEKTETAPTTDASFESKEEPALESAAADAAADAAAEEDEAAAEDGEAAAEVGTAEGGAAAHQEDGQTAPSARAPEAPKPCDQVTEEEEEDEEEDEEEEEEETKDDAPAARKAFGEEATDAVARLGDPLNAAQHIDNMLGAGVRPKRSTRRPGRALEEKVRARVAAVDRRLGRARHRDETALVSDRAVHRMKVLAGVARMEGEAVHATKIVFIALLRVLVRNALLLKNSRNRKILEPGDIYAAARGLGMHTTA